MKHVIVLCMVCAALSAAYSENYLVNGGQASTIRYSLTQEFNPVPGTKKVYLSFVVPGSFTSPTYTQDITDFKLTFTPLPSKKTDTQDDKGNRIITAQWDSPGTPVTVTTSFYATTRTILNAVTSQSPFPLPRDIPVSPDYLAPTALVQSDSSCIISRSKELVAGSETQFDAVQRILSWIVDHMTYVTPPRQYDALYSFVHKTGNCQNYSHLAAALMRSSGIPVRIVNGITLKEPYSIQSGPGSFTFKMGQGRHSWIEVFFPDIGWVPFDPQQTELFVSNRFIRVEVGKDNKETVNDGLVRWIQSKGVQAQPGFTETIQAAFVADSVQMSMDKQDYGPRKMLLCPKVESVFSPVSVPAAPKPAVLDTAQLQKLEYTEKVVFGNISFPRNIDFSTARSREKGQQDSFVLKKNFLVESAEYVTTRLTQYAQVFVLDKPMKLAAASLALHKFGGQGQLWLELYADDSDKPGALIAASTIKSTDGISTRQGYDWVNFNFSKDSPVLGPGQYWISLAFTGSPVINWFYTYGKSVGPVYGTRFKSVYDPAWSNALSYEFNYRVAGYLPQ